MSFRKEDRRSFLKTSLLVGAAAPLAGLITKILGSSAHAQGAKATGTPVPPAGGQAQKKDLVMISPKDPQASALGYVEDAAKVDVKKWPKKAGPDGAKQFCWNCQFYQVPPKTDPQKTQAAPCTIFGGRGVTAAGWCNTWVLTPGAKV